VNIRPVTGDVRAAGKPNSFVLRREIEKPDNGLEPGWLARNPAMKADRHHPWVTGAFGVKHAQR
jgi:hypothetical protein